MVADALYGSDSAFRRVLETRDQTYAVALRSIIAHWDPQTFARPTVAQWVERLKPKAWQRLSAGEGAQGPRLDAWAAIRIERHMPEGTGFWLLARRSIRDPTQIAYDYVFGPANTTRDEMVAVAGKRRTIEGALEAAKGEVGLDEYEVRRWQSWYRHVTHALLADAFLAVTRRQTSAKGAE